MFEVAASVVVLGIQEANSVFRNPSTGLWHVQGRWSDAMANAYDNSFATSLAK